MDIERRATKAATQPAPVGHLHVASADVSDWAAAIAFWRELYEATLRDRLSPTEVDTLVTALHDHVLGSAGEGGGARSNATSREQAHAPSGPEIDHEAFS